MNLINNKHNNGERITGEFCNMAWIIDTGASHHVTSVLSYLSNVCDVGGNNGLPNIKQGHFM